jgi:hypothetical protein
MAILEPAAVEVARGGAQQLPSVPELPPAEPRLAPRQNLFRQARAGLRPQPGNLAPRKGEMREQMSLPGPTLAHELTSLEAAGLDRILVAASAAAPPRQGWLFSVAVASGLLAVALSAIFYALPGQAGSPSNTPPPTPQPPTAPTPPSPPPDTHPLTAALEVTGVRFVTDLPGRPPEIHYMVVNHRNATLPAVVVTVVLRTNSSPEPLTQFSFRAPALGPYEAREMVSSIQRMAAGVELPSWRELRTEVRIEP